MRQLNKYPSSFAKSNSKAWARFKKKIKKIAHTKLRRGAIKYKYDGEEIEW